MFFSEGDIERVDLSGAASDSALVEATKRNGRTYHAYVLKKEGRPPPADEQQALFRQSLPDIMVHPPLPALPVLESAALPSAALIEASAGCGFANTWAETDNILRRIPLWAELEGRHLPSLSMIASARLLHSPKIELSRHAVVLQDRIIPVGPQGRFFLWWYAPPEKQDRPYPYYPAANVLRSAIQQETGQAPDVPPETFKDKIVFIGSTASGLGDVKASPTSPLTPGVEIQATALDNILHGDIVQRIPQRTIIILLVACCLLQGLLTRARHAAPGIIGAVTGLGAIIILGTLALVQRQLFFDMTPLLCGVLLTFIGVTLFNYMSEQHHARMVRRLFEHYLDHSVVRDLIARPDGLRLGGENRHATVLFTDIAGFTHHAENMKPEQVVQFMNIFLEAMTEIIIEEGGFVDKFVGDEIMAIFGAPQDLPDHADRACRAAWRMQQKTAQMQDEFKTAGCTAPVFARTGIATGRMIVGNMGSEHRMNYTGMGDTVNLAARIEGANKIFGTRLLVSEETAQQAPSFCSRAIDRVRVVGREQPQTLYEVVAPLNEADDTAELRRRFLQAREAYRNRQWDDALQQFNELAQEGDATAERFAQRCEQYRNHPPPDDWDGVFNLETK
jgi:adenylate cyclase